MNHLFRYTTNSTNGQGLGVARKPGRCGTCRLVVMSIAIFRSIAALMNYAERSAEWYKRVRPALVVEKNIANV